jgi:hypothetical protein
MNDKIFHTGADGTLMPMLDTPYDQEAVLQQLLARYPEVLAGGKPSSGSESRWALVASELGVPRELGGGDHWSLDHFFVDQEATPTFVEDKRSSDPRIRREVVAQMLDYAANAVTYWNIATLRQRFAETAIRQGTTPEEVMQTLGVADPDQFWNRVEKNLRDGTIRLVFVADKIPPELRRIVEFLNEQMQAEVIAIEVRQYVWQGPESGETLKTLVPSVIGLTERARVNKGTSPSFDDRLAAADEVVRTVDGLLTQLAQGPDYVARVVGTSRQVFAREPDVSLLTFYPTWASVELNLAKLREFGMESLAAELHESLSVLVGNGKQLTEKYPCLPCDVIVNKWRSFESDILPRYKEGRIRAWELEQEATPSLSGQVIYDGYARQRSSLVRMGRQGGINAFASQDLVGGAWKARQYRVSSATSGVLPANWFPIADFVRKIDEAGNLLAGPN